MLETFIWHAPLYIRFEHKMRYFFRDETFPPVVSVCGGLYLSKMGEICQEGVNQIQQKLYQEREVCGASVIFIKLDILYNSFPQGMGC